MSVLIKGMKMPENCSECQLEYDQMCCSVVGFNWYGQDYIDIGFDPNFNKLPECPLIEIPNKHGDLIDRDAFKADYGMKDDCADCEKEMHGKVKACRYDCTYSKMDFCDWLDNADVVIEAEGK